MYKVVKTGYIIPAIQKSRVTCVSRRWRKWKTLIAPGTCGYCLRMNGRILATGDNAWYNIPVHLNCGCSAENVTAIVAGTATNGGMNGVDRYLLLFGCLPSGYLTKEAARKAGWKPALGNLDEIFPAFVKIAAATPPASIKGEIVLLFCTRTAALYNLSHMIFPPVFLWIHFRVFPR